MNSMASGVSGARWTPSHDAHVSEAVRSRSTRGHEGGGMPDEHHDPAHATADPTSSKGAAGVSTDPTGRAGSRLDAFA